MTSLAKIPVTVITGFLGSGKTTLIRHLMTNADGKKLAVLVNEFGSEGVDGEILKSCADANCPEENIVELANGCICCTVADDFIPTMQTLLARKVRPDHILIETSGLALPKPLLKAFDWPEIRSRITVDGVIALADAEAVAAGRFAPDPSAIEAQRAADSRAGANRIQVRVELQADCLAGVWAKHSDEKWKSIEQGDVEAALQTASAIGDDRLQKQARGYAVPDSFTHGTSEQRQRWFSTGLKAGMIAACNTFSPTAQL